MLLSFSPLSFGEEDETEAGLVQLKQQEEACCKSHKTGNAHEPLYNVFEFLKNNQEKPSSNKPKSQGTG